MTGRLRRFPQRVKKLGCIRCHCTKRQPWPQIRHWKTQQTRLKLRVAIVEADHTVAVCRQILAERDQPQNHLRAQTGDQ